jgi:uncharacterized protein (TIGR02453 family)
LAKRAYFTEELFLFLAELKRHNRREWFLAHRARYEEAVRLPAQRFIVDFDKHLGKVSPHFVADPRPVGGSLFRIHRDVRFSRDKSPYKTHTGLHFPHRSRGDAHAPGFYLHLEPGQVFLGIGIWRPDATALGRIRGKIVSEPAAWKKARDDRRFRGRFELGGESLARAPRGFPCEHPFLEDLKRKEFVASVRMSEREVMRTDFPERLGEACGDGKAFVRWLCAALELPF